MDTPAAWENTSLPDILAESEGTPWGAVIRALIPSADARGEAMRSRGSHGSLAHRKLAWQIRRNKERIARIDADALVAVFATQGRPALYVRCVEVSDLDLEIERLLVGYDRADADYDTKMAHLKASAEAAKRATGVEFDKFTKFTPVVTKTIYDFEDAIGKAKR